MHVAVEEAGGVARIVVAGELDVAGADELRTAGQRALADTDCRRLVIDMSAVEFIDSTGIGTLVELRNAAVERQIPVSLQDPSSRVVEVLRLTALDTVFHT